MRKNWTEFTIDLLSILNKLKEKNVLFLSYAKTYAESIPDAIDSGFEYGYSDVESARTQVLYVLSNLEGVDKITLNMINNLCIEYDIDVKRIIKTMVRDCE